MLFLYLYSQEGIPMDELFKQLKCTEEGLTTDVGMARLQLCGPNKLEEKKVSSLPPFF